MDGVMVLGYWDYPNIPIHEKISNNIIINLFLLLLSLVLLQYSMIKEGKWKDNEKNLDDIQGSLKDFYKDDD